MKTINVTRFKEQCLSIVDHLHGEGLVITKRGRPVARLIPFSADCDHLFGALRGKIRVKGDIESTGLKWNAQS